MAAKRKEMVWQCDNPDCRRPMDSIIMTEMWKPGIDEPFRICNQPGCWAEAEARGYTPERPSR